ncbi:MAG TPA: hypothetical protein VGI16_03900 [Candidatus Acidoferrum sp.]|jgi:hypothetical protein
MKSEKFRGLSTSGISVALAALLLGAPGLMAARNGMAVDGAKQQAADSWGGLYCNIKALTAGERARHKALTDKLLAARNEVVETDKGYEFQYSPERMSVAEVAEWVVAESKCCPFYDFHIDLEKEGKLICLRLTGREGVKEFIRRGRWVRRNGQ